MIKKGWFLEVESQLGKSFNNLRYLDKHLYSIERTLIISDYNLFKNIVSKMLKTLKDVFVSPGNVSLVGILITIGDVTDTFAKLPFAA